MTASLILRLSNSLVLNNYRKYSDKKQWNILFFGADSFSLATLKSLHIHFQNGILVDRLEVVTSNKHNAVGKFSQKHKIAMHSWPVNSLEKGLFNLGIVVSFGHLIPKSLIDYFPFGMLNVHASLLPRWRGGAPIIHSLMNGDTVTGVSIMQLQAHHFDIGNIINQKQFPIKLDTLQPELHDNLAQLGADALIESLHNLPERLKSSQKQDNNLVTLAPKITQEMAHVNWTLKTSQEIYNLYRALFGIYPLITRFQKHTVKLHTISIEKEFLQLRYPPGKFMFDKESKSIRIWCKDGHCLLVHSLSVPGKKPMRAVDFRNGYFKNVGPEECYFEDFLDAKISEKITS